MSSLSEAARRALEGLMKSGTYEYQTELVRQWAREEEEERRKGREEGLRKGREEGRQEGLQEGLCVSGLTAILEVLDTRGIKVDEVSQRRLAATRDLSQLKLWLRKAVTVQSVKELFESEPAPGAEAGKTGKRTRSTRAPRPRSKR
jgi:flagellar biosynthesis/type III secretory pathway protein FliH